MVKSSFVMRGSPVYCRMFSNISGLYSVDSNSTLSIVTTKIVF